MAQRSQRTETQKYLQLRALKKSKTPEFQRQESWRYVRIHDPWRKPKGVDSHMRLSIKGWPALVKIGYRGPREARGLHPSGYRDILVHNEAELEALSKESDAARLAATVGRRKKIELAIRARELGIRVLNGRGLLPSEVKAPEGEEEEEKEVKTEEEVQETITSAQPSEEQPQQEEKQQAEEGESTAESASVTETEQGSSTSPEEPSEVSATEHEVEQQETEQLQKPKPKKVSKAKKKPGKKAPTKKASKAKSKKKQSKKKKSKESD